MKTYEEKLEWLFSRFPSYQNVGGRAYKAGIETITLFDKELGSPHRKYPCIHVAGTNGKGSTSHMLAAALAGAGYKVGLYTSPHLVDFRERMKVCTASGYEMVPKSFVESFIDSWGEFFERENPSFFEITTAMAFTWFASVGVDVAVIETGLGGRLDSTNVITPVLSVITNIGLEHCAHLGYTLEEIAFEKGGIIKPGVSAVVGETVGETLPVFERIAAERGARLVLAERRGAGRSANAGLPEGGSAAEGSADRAASMGSPGIGCAGRSANAGLPEVGSVDRAASMGSPEMGSAGRAANAGLPEGGCAGRLPEVGSADRSSVVGSADRGPDAGLPEGGSAAGSSVLGSAGEGSADRAANAGLPEVGCAGEGSACEGSAAGSANAGLPEMGSACEGSADRAASMGSPEIGCAGRSANAGLPEMGSAGGSSVLGCAGRSANAGLPEVGSVDRAASMGSPEMGSAGGSANAGLPEGGSAAEAAKSVTSYESADGSAISVGDLDLKGEYQSVNLRTVICALDELSSLGFRWSAEGLCHAASLTGLRGRWETLRRNGLSQSSHIKSATEGGGPADVVCDTGHNAHGLRYVFSQLASSLSKYEKLWIIFGVVADKDVDAVAPLMLKPSDRINYIFTNAASQRALDARELAARLSPYGVTGRIAPNVADAIELADSLAGPRDLIFIGGSNFVVCEAL